jgi:hypothetical protein
LTVWVVVNVDTGVTVVVTVRRAVTVDVGSVVVPRVAP